MTIVGKFQKTDGCGESGGTNYILYALVAHSYHMRLAIKEMKKRFPDSPQVGFQGGDNCIAQFGGMMDSGMGLGLDWTGLERGFPAGVWHLKCQTSRCPRGQAGWQAGRHTYLQSPPFAHLTLIRAQVPLALDRNSRNLCCSFAWHLLSSDFSKYLQIYVDSVCNPGPGAESEGKGWPRRH